MSAALFCIELDSPPVTNVDRIALVLRLQFYEYRSESWQPSSEHAVTSAEMRQTHQTTEHCNKLNLA